jgi:hypothetical protein
MVLNDLLIRQNVFTKLILKDGDKELPKELKVKVMRIRMAYNKIKKNFDSEIQEFMESIIPEEFRILSNKTDRTSDENDRLELLTNNINSEYQEFIRQKGSEEVNGIDDTFTLDEYTELLEVNAGNDTDINGVKISAINFMEVVYELFVKED